MNDLFSRFLTFWERPHLASLLSLLAHPLVNPELWENLREIVMEKRIRNLYELRRHHDFLGADFPWALLEIDLPLGEKPYAQWKEEHQAWIQRLTTTPLEVYPECDLSGSFLAYALYWRNLTSFAEEKLLPKSPTTPPPESEVDSLPLSFELFAEHKKKLSIRDVVSWSRDAYSFYVRNVLKLYEYTFEIDPIDALHKSRSVYRWLKEVMKDGCISIDRLDHLLNESDLKKDMSLLFWKEDLRQSSRWLQEELEKGILQKGKESSFIFEGVEIYGGFDGIRKDSDGVTYISFHFGRRSSQTAWLKGEDPEVFLRLNLAESMTHDSPYHIEIWDLKGRHPACAIRTSFEKMASNIKDNILESLENSEGDGDSPCFHLKRVR